MFTLQTSFKPHFCYTLNLSFLSLEHVIYKQLQINIKRTFIFMFLFHVLILKEEKQLFPRCKLFFVIWIQVIVIIHMLLLQILVL
jgi:hypothetical protein